MCVCVSVCVCVRVCLCVCVFVCLCVFVCVTKRGLMDGVSKTMLPKNVFMNHSTQHRVINIVNCIATMRVEI